MYHISLALSPEQVKQLRFIALERGLTVKELVTRLVVKELGHTAGVAAKQEAKSKK